MKTATTRKNRPHRLQKSQSLLLLLLLLLEVGARPRPKVSGGLLLLRVLARTRRLLQLSRGTAGRRRSSSCLWLLGFLARAPAIVLGRCRLRRIVDVGVTELSVLVHEVVAGKLAAAYLAGIVLDVEIEQSHLAFLDLRLLSRGSRWSRWHLLLLLLLLGRSCWWLRLDELTLGDDVLAVGGQQVTTRVLAVAVLRLERVPAVAARVAAARAVLRVVVAR